MVQGCDLIMELNSPASKNVKVAVPTEEQKRIAQLSSIERIDRLQDTYISYMVDITKKSQEECAMQLAMTDMNVELAIENLIDGNSEQWEVTKKRSRPEKKQQQNTDTDTKRSGRSNERGRAPKSEGDQERGRSSRGGSRGGGSVRGSSRGGAGGATRGTATRGRGGKRQLPPRMDRQRNDRSDSGSWEPRGDSSASRGSRGGGRVNGSYRHHQRGAKRPSDTNDWTTATSEDWGEDWGGTDSTTPAVSSGGGGDWGGDSTGWGDTAPSSNQTSQQETPPAPQPEPVNPWMDKKETIAETVARAVSPVAPAVVSAPPPPSSNPWSNTDGEHKRPAYTQAFPNNPLSSLLTSTSSSSFGFPFSQQSSNVVSSDQRHEQAPSSDVVSSTFSMDPPSSGGGGLLSGSLAGRKISVEQLFKMHSNEKSAGLSEPSIGEEHHHLHQHQIPASPPNSSTSSTNSTKKSSKRNQPRTIPSEPVQMPGSTMESLDVQFGSIFLDTTDDDILSEAKAVAAGNTPAPKTDAATSTTPGVSGGGGMTEKSSEIPGIHKISSDPVAPIEQSPVRSLLHQPSTSDTGSSPYHGNSLGSSLQKQSTSQSTSSAAPPNLPPPNMDNIRTANSLITSRTMSGEQQQPQQHQQQHHQHQAQHQAQQHQAQHHQQHQHSSQFSSGMQQQQQSQQQQQPQPKKNLPPGVYPTNNSSRAMYYGGGSDHQTSQQQQSQQQHSSIGYDNMSRYYTSNSFEMRQQMQPAGHESAFSSVSNDKQQQQQQHYRGAGDLGNSSHQPLHGAGLSSGISSTNAATGLNAAGYHAPLLGYTYPHPMQAYPNNALYANYYTPFNHAAINFAQQQKPSIPSYPGGNAFSGTHADASSPFQTQYEEYPKDLYGGGGGAKHPTTSSSDYNKLMGGGGAGVAGGSDKAAAGGAGGAGGMFNMGGYMFPNYMANFQQGQAAQPMMQQSSIQQRGMDPSSRSSTGSLGAPKHYWSQR